jgi:hypothetical protein
MGRLKPEKLHVNYLAGTIPESLNLPRRYTLTHSDMTGHLFLSIGNQYNTKEISKLYTRLMRDEVLAELIRGEGAVILNVYCHISGGFVFGGAKWRFSIFRSELPLVLEAIRYGDRTLFEQNPELDQSPVHVHFQSTDSRFNKVERWGVVADYKIGGTKAGLKGR